jgi:ribosomal protein S18 acetylase RimI-like enzyme
MYRKREGNTMIRYETNAPITVDMAIDLYRRSTLGERRPVDRPDVFAKMLAHADLTVTAWDGELLVGIARTLTDFGYVAYLADLAVDAAYQRQGIGRKLVALTQEGLDETAFITLLAAPKANEYYERIGFEHNARAWILPAGKPPKSSE